eukprot:TRINITY_DN9020_c0_g1_i2.p1 TRINITY_DN9020_c0_g1~~TRINITY_DN9020_c0_g1_i2.p1  ORF type:complete len:442 (-),score=32.81 TRINITY_DN9020_c0_g1_i2:75-1400(-)
MKHEPNPVSILAGTMPGKTDKPAKLDHLSGARALAAGWIVCYHFMSQKPSQTSIFYAARTRANTAVNFFIVLSGFITQWVYSTQAFECWADLKGFWARRLSRVVVTAWIAMSAGVLVYAATLNGAPFDFGHVGRCFAFVEPWLSPLNWCPNGQTWTIASLIPSWLLYPLTRRVVAWVETVGETAGLVLFCVVMWAVTFVPCFIVFARSGFTLRYLGDQWMYTWPPSQLSDFALGVATAALAQRYAAKHAVQQDGQVKIETMHQKCGRFADISVLSILLMLTFVPNSRRSGNDRGYEPLVGHAFGLLYSCFLFGSAAGGGSGLAARLLRHPSLVSLGAMSFEVYLFQHPYHEMLVGLGKVTGLWSMQNESHRNDDPESFVFYFLSLWVLSGIYLAYVEGPLVRCLQRCLGIERSSTGGEGSGSGDKATPSDVKYVAVMGPEE